LRSSVSMFIHAFAPSPPDGSTHIPSTPWWHTSHPNPHRLGSRDTTHVGDGTVKVGERRPHLPVQLSAQRGEFDPTAGPLEQRAAELAFRG
jgi:hypothetical protein